MQFTRTLNLTSCLVLLAALSACSDSDDPTTPAADAGPLDGSSTGGEDVTDTPDTTDPDTADVSDSTDGSSVVESDADAGDTADVEVDDRVPCETNGECGEGGACVGGFCADGTCFDREDWVFCQDYFNALEPDSGRFGACVDGTCQQMCLTDDQCESDQICADFGVCVAFDDSYTALDRPGDGELAPVEVGFGESLWNFPVGVPAGGYGEFGALNDGQYALSLRASVGQMHGLYIRSAVIDDGVNPLLIIRLPAIFTGMELHEEVALRLQEETGRDWRENILISSTHTHSGPCRHWHLPSDAALPLGSFGIGEFHQQFADWIADSTVEAALDALGNVEPARVGYQIVEAYDTFDKIGRDRWSDTPQFDDNRLLLIRVDDLEGQLQGVLFSFAAHGTTNGTTYLSGDVLEGAERVMQRMLGAETGRYIPTLFLNQNSGTLSPAAGYAGHGFPQALDPVGARVADVALPVLQEMTTSTDVRLQSSLFRFPITYDLLGYERNELSGNGGPPFGGEYHYGGLSCTGRQGADRDYSTYDEPEDLNCVGALQYLLFNRPPSTLMRSQMSALTIGIGDAEPLTVLTVPGELSMELSWEILRELRDEFGVDPLNAWTLGYTNDHLLYTVPTNLRGERPPFPGLDLPHPDNTGDGPDGLPLIPGKPDDYPDFAFSALQGGYEATMNPWGYRMGDYLVARAVDTFGRLLDPAAETGVPEARPNRMTRREMGTFTVAETPASALTILRDVPDTVVRYETIELAWVGGHPGAEQPQMPVVTLQRNFGSEGSGDIWETLTLDNTRPYSNLEGMFMTRLRRNGDVSEWTARWEELHNFPAGEYRIVVNGHHQEGGERKPYELISNTFEVVAMQDVVVQGTLTGEQVEGIIGYPAAERMRFLDSRSDPGAVEGNFRTRHVDTPTGQINPPELDVDFAAANIAVSFYGADSTTPLDIAVNVGTRVDNEGGRRIPRATFSATVPINTPPGTIGIRVEFQDNHGNTGSLDLPLGG